MGFFLHLLCHNIINILFYGKKICRGSRSKKLESFLSISVFWTRKTMSKFIHFELTEVPQFMFPAKSTNFQLGYFVESRGNKKFRIVDRCTLQSAYDTQVSGKLSLWVDHHIQMLLDIKVERDERQETIKRKES